MPRPIAAHDSVAIDVQLEPPLVEGVFSQPIDLYVSGRKDPLRVTMTGRAVMPLPDRVDFGSSGSFAEKTLELCERAKQLSVRVADASCDNVHVRVRVSDDSITIHVVLAELPLGDSVDSSLRVRYSNSAVPSQRVLVHGSNSGGLVADPDPLVFGSVRLNNGPVSKEIRIRSESEPMSDLVPINGAPGDGLLSVRLSQRSEKEAIYAITVTPRAPQELNETVVFASQDSTRRISVRCVGVIW